MYYIYELLLLVLLTIVLLTIAAVLCRIFVSLEALCSSTLVFSTRVLNLMLSLSFLIGAENKQGHWIFQTERWRSLNMDCDFLRSVTLKLEVVTDICL